MAETRIAERITVGLIPKASTELTSLAEAGDMSKTEVVNRAISLYAFVTGEIDQGNDVLVRDGKTGEVERLRLL